MPVFLLLSSTRLCLCAFLPIVSDLVSVSCTCPRVRCPLTDLSPVMNPTDQATAVANTSPSSSTRSSTVRFVTVILPWHEHTNKVSHGHIDNGEIASTYHVWYAMFM
ncbi:uncharacterized protein V1518DRAFT_68076 [Limtongia smithiae]|uniref:uncharacterized protein n=1 Tax=Limtongia smithiae TaxID=1125753 RepID=UPI0034CF6F29